MYAENIEIYILDKEGKNYMKGYEINPFINKVLEYDPKTKEIRTLEDIPEKVNLGSIVNELLQKEGIKSTDLSKYIITKDIPTYSSFPGCDLNILPFMSNCSIKELN